MKTKNSISVYGQIGICGNLQVFLGFAPASILHAMSFTDTLNEDSGEGYQRPRNLAHSRNFRQYIKRPNTSTIPLTFNLRNELSSHWRIKKVNGSYDILYLQVGERCLSQVDCQHRLGELGHDDISLAFMAYIGLDLRTEMALFNVINNKAKGLASSLTDFHESNLLADLATEAPQLFIARKLNEDPTSPWYKLIRYGGITTSGLKRRTSLRMMQKAILRFLKKTSAYKLGDIDDKYELIAFYWNAIKTVFSSEWEDHRHHLLTKGVGLYSLMYLLADFINESSSKNISNDELIIGKLKQLKSKVDWSSNGMFANAGGQKGALEVYQVLRKAVNV